MAFIRFAWVRRLLGVSAAAGLLICLGCGRKSAQLRIYNDGSVAFEHLTVLYPRDQVTFGDVGAKATTSYREAPHGVGRDASFRFVSNGVPVQQNVIDFIGWKPLSGKAFTYRVHIEPGRSQPFLRLVEVVRDK